MNTEMNANRYCIGCGKPLDGDSRFCTNCGRPVQNTPPAQTPPDPRPGDGTPRTTPPAPQKPEMPTSKRRRWYIPVILCVALLLAGVLSLRLILGQKENRLMEYHWTEDSPLFDIEDLENVNLSAISFRRTLQDAPSDAWDVSQDGDGSVLAWLEKDGHTRPEHRERTYELVIAANGIITAPDDCCALFMCLNVETINFNGCLDTSRVTDMTSMFQSCWSLEKVDFSGFDTHNVTDMNGMFCACSALEEADLSSFDTGNVTDMGGMFASCLSLEEVNLSSFDTGNVTDMSGMFVVCHSLEEVDLSSFDTGNVTDMSGMFAGCYSLEAVDLSSFDTGNVTDMSRMFASCDALSEIRISAFDLSRAKNTEDMFEGCNALDTGSIPIINAGS